MQRPGLALTTILASLFVAPSLTACADDPSGSDDELGDTGETGDETGDTGDTGETGETGGTEDTGPPPFQEVYDQGLTQYLGTVEPSEVSEDGDTTTYHFAVEDGPSCIYGDPYHISDRPGSDGSGEDLLIYLQGGGACWSETCVTTQTASWGVPENGMLNRGLAGNPFADWDVVFFPYCDGSVFMGDNDFDEDMDGEVDRYHRGIRNLSAGLDVAKLRYPAPSRVVLAGSSAGSYGVHVANMLVRAQWPSVEIIVVADAGLGLGRPEEPEFLSDVFGEWGTLKYLPASCPECDDTHITKLVDWQLRQDPNMRFVALTAYQDAVIGGFFLALGGAVYEQLLNDEIAWLAGQHPDRYDRFFFEGALHTVTSNDSMNNDSAVASFFDTTIIDGVSAMQWMTMLLEGDPAFDDLLQ